MAAVYPLPKVPGELVLDISHWEGVIDWEKVRQTGISRVIVKLTDGRNFGDPLGGYNVRRAQEVGFRVGRYHYLRFPVGIFDQMDVFRCALYGAYHQTGDIILLDCESTGGVVGYKCRQKFLEAYRFVLANMQAVPEIYTRMSWWKPTIGIIDWEKEGLPRPLLHAADYGLDGKGNPFTGPRGVPWPPTWRVWKRWQYTDKGHVPGIPGAVDLNVEQ